MPVSYGRVHGKLNKMLPLGRRLLIKPSQMPDFKGKIIIPDSCKELAPTVGRVIAIGFGLTDDESNRIRVDDMVCYSKYAGVEFKFDDGMKLLIVHEDDMLAIVSGDISIEEDVAETNGR